MGPALVPGRLGRRPRGLAHVPGRPRAPAPAHRAAVHPPQGPGRGRRPPPRKATRPRARAPPGPPPPPPPGPRCPPRTVPGGDVPAYVEKTVGQATWRYRARLLLHAPAAALAGRLPPAVEPETGGARTRLGPR